MQELKIKVKPSELEMILGFISLLKKQGMFSRVEPEIADISVNQLEHVEEQRMQAIEEELIQQINEIDEGKAKLLNSKEFKDKIDTWKAEKLS